MKGITPGIYSCNVLELSRIHNPSGNITIVQSDSVLPFRIKRVYYLYDVPGGSDRGGHAHKALKQLIVAASGSFDVILDDGGMKKTVHLNRPNYGLLIVPGIWREIINFSSGAICLVLASEKYNPSDYIRDYSEFRKLKDLADAD